METPVAVPDVEKPEPTIEQVEVQEEQDEKLLAVSEIQKRLQLIIRRLDSWHAGSYKKLPAQTVISDYNFMLMTIQVLSSALEELRQQRIDAGPRQGEIVGLDGKVIKAGEERSQLVKLV